MGSRDRDAEVREVSEQINSLLDELFETVAALNELLAQPGPGPLERSFP